MPLGYGKLFTDARHNWLYNSEPEPELERPLDHPAARQGAGRLVVDQRPAVSCAARPRTSITGASSAMPAGASRTCCRTFKVRGPAARRGRPARRRRAAWRLRCERAASAVRRLHRGVRAGGLSAQRRFQRRRPGRRRLFPAHDAQRAARVDRARLSCARARSATISRSCRTRWRRASCSRAAARSASNICKGGATQTARANGEVILSGGAFNSPQLLQLSGVGPADLLQQHGIEVVADMPGVGADLQDHFQVRIAYRCTEPITMNDIDELAAAEDRGRHALHAVPQGHAHHRRGLCGRVPARPSPRCRDAGRAIAFHHLLGRQDRRQPASVPGLHRVGVPVAPREPRHRAHQVGRSARTRPRSSRAT